MRKKYLSALLFGALLFASAGTFTSCKDYDDDINNLQDQITANADAIKALQDLVNAGKYVSGVAMEGQTITFTFSDGSTQPITIPAGEKGQTVVVKDGELYIDDEPTGIKVAEELDTEAGLVKSENGTWWVLNENGEYTNTNIPVSGITVSGSEKDGYTFTIYNEKGEAQTVKLPTAASSITSIDFSNDLVTNPTTLEPVKVTSYDKYDFTFAKNVFDLKKGNVEIKATDWKGPKTLPVDGSYIFSSESTIDVRIDPVGTDATLVSYTLTNTLNQDAPSIKLKADAEDSDKALDNSNIAGRAANLGNGLYTLSMDNFVVAKDDVKGVYTDGLATINPETVYAVNAGYSCRSKYALNIVEVKACTLKNLVLSQGNSSVSTDDMSDDDLTGTTFKAKVGVPVKVSGNADKAIYDMYLEVANEDAKFQVTFDQENRTFTIGQNPDWDTRDVAVPIIVWTVANDGSVYKTIVKVSLDAEFDTSSQYQAVSHNIAVEEQNNVEYIDLQTMKDGFKSDDDLASWIKNVDLTKVSYDIYTDKNCSADKKVTNTGKVSFATVSKKDYSVAALTGKNGASANYIRMIVDNNATAACDLKLDTQYYIKASYNDGKNTLNSIVVPITFTAPTVAEQFAVSTNYQNGTENSIKAFYNNWEANIRNINLVTYFKAYDKYATLSLDNDAVITKFNGVDKKSADLATLTNTDIANGYINLNQSMILNDGTNREAGYGQALKVNVKNTNYTDTEWAYANDADTKYSFTISIFSPIYEGTIAATDGSKNLTVIANSETGSDITKDMVSLTDYADNKYNVVPDVANNGNTVTNGPTNLTDIWSAKQIDNVWVDETGDNNYIKEIKLRGVDARDADNVRLGAITLIAQPVPSYTEPTEITVHVKDVWGYVTSQPLNITLTKNTGN